MRIILASFSPRRKELLKKLLDKYNMEYEVIGSTVDETSIKEMEKRPDELVKKLSYAKAEDVFHRIKDNKEDLVIVGSDTIVYFENEILGKPLDEKDAFVTLKQIQNNSNEVYTGMTVIIKKKDEIKYETVYSKSIVNMKKMTYKDIQEYIATKEPLDKAGSYAIQGIGNKYVENYVGDYDSIVGLDIIKLEEILLYFKILKK